MELRFRTDYTYTDRESKAKYVWLKYHPILRGHILDIGADTCYLKEYLPKDTEYLGIGLGEYVDQQVDLEKEKIPFPDNSFDCVLCLDVLEHLDNIHEIFDDVCRVSRRYVIISLPNPWTDFYKMLCRGDYRPGQPMKFYGLPLEVPQDRHKWFFSGEEAEKFIIYRAEKNRMRILQVDRVGIGSEGNNMRGWLRRKARDILFRKDLNLNNLYAGRLWAVLEKEDHGQRPH